MVLYHIIIYHIILYYVILYYSILYYIIWDLGFCYYTISYQVTQYYIILYYTILYYSLSSLRAGSAGEGDGCTPYGTALVSAICSSPSRSRTCHEWFDSKCVFQPICCSSMALDPYVVSNWQLDSFHHVISYGII